MGFGLQAAAAEYHLGFVPLVTERLRARSLSRDVDGRLVAVDQTRHQGAQRLIDPVEAFVLEQVIDELTVDQPRIGEQVEQMRFELTPRFGLGEPAQIAGVDLRTEPGRRD